MPFSTSAAALAARLDGERVLLVRNIDMLSHVLDLPEHERKLLLYAALAKYKRDLRAVMVDCKVAHSQEAFQILAGLTGASPAAVAASLRPGSAPGDAQPDRAATAREQRHRSRRPHAFVGSLVARAARQLRQ
ncbi:hypothetical protein ACU4GD_02530 [Cupriavidus basilensis]